MPARSLPRARALNRRWPASRAAGPALALLALLGAPRAQADKVWANASETRVLEVEGFLKSLGAGMVLPRALVANTETLERIAAQAREAADPAGAQAIAAPAALPRQAGLATQTARLGARLLWGPSVQVEAAWELSALVASDPAFAAGAALGGTPVSTASEARRRLVDFDGTLSESGTLRARHNLDRLSLRLSLPGADVVAGRQVLGWGSGKLWNPTDLPSPFAPAEIDKEVRRGVDALRVSVPLGVTGLLDALWLPQPRAADQGGVLRAQVNLFGTDFALSAAKYVSDLVIGADFAGEVGALGVHGEVAYTWAVEGWSAGPLSVRERFVRAVGGVEWRPLERLVLLAEYHFNGFGARHPRDYLAKLQSDRVARGEVFGAGRHYLGLVSVWALSDLVSLQTTALLNAQDPSAVLVPVLEWSAAQRVLVRAGLFLPLGERPESARFERLGPADVLTSSAAFQEAAHSLGARSEYGMAAAGALVQMAIHL